MNSMFTQPGYAALMQYLAHKGGIDLFRAYVEQRAADAEYHTQRKGEIAARFNGSTWAEYEALSKEMLRLRILEELDPVMRDLLRFCENPGPVDDQLPNLRSALRIGKGHAPNDTALAIRHVDIVRHWVQAYLSMETGNYRSESAIANEIAGRVNVSRTTAFNAWRGFKRREPWQASWAKKIEAMAKQRSAKKSVAKPKPAKTSLKYKLRYGEGVQPKPL